MTPPLLLMKAVTSIAGLILSISVGPQSSVDRSSDGSLINTGLVTLTLAEVNRFQVDGSGQPQLNRQPFSPPVHPLSARKSLFRWKLEDGVLHMFPASPVDPELR